MNPYIRLWGAAAVAAATLFAEPAVLRLKSGRSASELPAFDLRDRASTIASSTAIARPLHRHVLLQYESAPDQTEIDRLRASGFRVLSYVPDSALIVSVPTNALPGVFGSASAYQLEAQDKFSRVIRQPRGVEGPTVVLELYEDVDPALVIPALEALDITVLNHPDLPAHHLLVRGTMARLHQAAALDDVAYVFPASDTLINGGPTVACLGGMAGTMAVAANLSTTFGEGWDGPGKGSASLGVWYGTLTPQLSPTQIRSEIQRALNAWSNVASLRFSTAQSATQLRTISILFGAGSHGDPYPFDGPGKVLAHTFYPPPNPESLAGDMHFDGAETWRVGSNIDLFSVALHELGHALGLGHSDDVNAVMYPYYKLVSGLAAGDITSIQLLYAASSNPPALPATPAAPTTPVTPTTPAAPAAPTPPTDHTAPTLTIASPAGTSLSTTSPTVVVKGTASDNVGVTSVTWTATGNRSGTANGTASFATPAISLFWGANTIVITAKDAAGNSSWRSVVVTRK